MINYNVLTMRLIFEIEKDKSKEEVIEEITFQLSLDQRCRTNKKINKYLVEPTLHLAIWDYNENQTKYPVWLILKSEIDDTCILFSEYGFDFW